MTWSSDRHSRASAPWPTWGSITETGRISADPLGPAEPVEGGDRHHHRVDRAVLAPTHPGVHVPPQLDEGQVRTQVGQLGPAAGRAGGHRPAGRQVAQPPTDQAVAGVGPLGDGRQHQSLRGSRREILGRVHGHVGPAVQHRRLHLLDEYPLAADAVERHVGLTVPPVLTTTGSTRRSGWARISSAETSSACRRARGEPRVARRNSRPEPEPVSGPGPDAGAATRLQVEQQAEGFHQPLAPGGAGGLLQQDRRLVQQLGQHGPGHRVDLGPVGLRQLAELAPPTLQLGRARLLQPGPQGGDDRGGAAGPGTPPGSGPPPRPRSPAPPRPRCGARPWPAPPPS